VTTNPPLSYNAIKEDRDYWVKWIIDRIKRDGPAPSVVVFWDTYKEIVKRGAEAYRPIFEASNFKYGYISGRVDPRTRHDVDKMVSQGTEFHSLSPNL